MGLLWNRFSRGVNAASTLMGYLSGFAIVACTIILVYEVVVRYVLAWPTDWEIEMSIMLLIVATFMGAAFTQANNGHVGIEVLDSVLSANANRWRNAVGDVLSMAFCAFVAWHSWKFFHEAWSDGRTGNTAWGPKLWPVYFSMALGMSLLSLQLLVQIGERHVKPHWEDAE